MSDSNLAPSGMSASGSTNSELAELKAMCVDLQWQTYTLRIALLIVAGALSAFFWVEVRRSSQTLTMIRPQTAQILEASKAQGPIVDKFIGQLVEFSKTHPDFAAVLKKYPIQSSPSPTTAAAPVSAPPAKSN